jgi:glycosyltransferase involved in cell wall biosynthesis
VRIAYITPYQGPTVVERRPIVRNRSMSNRTKIELIAQLLRSNSHDVEVFSHGEVIENRLTFYPAFEEPQRFHPRVPVHYVSALPIPRLNGLWAGHQMVRLFRRRHRVAPFDVVIIFNLKVPQIACAHEAVRLGIPVIFEYEDDAFREKDGELSTGLRTRYHHRGYRKVIARVSGCIGVSPYLLSQVPSAIPKLLLRGVVGEDVLTASERQREAKKDIVLFSGTHIESNGVEELITAWRSAPIPGWELHITGYGGLTEQLRRMAQDVAGVVFHGLVSREDLVNLMCSAKICINPHAVSQTPGNVFAFKIIEYLASGAHVITTPMGAVEPELEKGITYLRDNSPQVVASTLQSVIQAGRYGETAETATQQAYGTAAVSKAFDALLREALEGYAARGNSVLRGIKTPRHVSGAGR